MSDFVLRLPDHIASIRHEAERYGYELVPSGRIKTLYLSASIHDGTFQPDAHMPPAEVTSTAMRELVEQAGRLISDKLLEFNKFGIEWRNDGPRLIGTLRIIVPKDRNG